MTMFSWESRCGVSQGAVLLGETVVHIDNMEVLLSAELEVILKL